MGKRLLARSIMTSPVEMIEENATLDKAAAKMLSLGVSSLVVAPSDDEEPFGIVTSADLVGAYARALRPHLTCVCEVMTSPLILVTPNVPVEHVARLMDRTMIRHVAVFNGREVLGIISHRDLLRALTPEHLAPQASSEPKAAAKA